MLDELKNWDVVVAVAFAAGVVVVAVVGNILKTVKQMVMYIFVLELDSDVMDSYNQMEYVLDFDSLMVYVLDSDSLKDYV